MKTVLELLKQNEQLTMNELVIDMKNKYPTFYITSQHSGQVVYVPNEVGICKKTMGRENPKPYRSSNVLTLSGPNR